MNIEKEEAYSYDTNNVFKEITFQNNSRKLTAVFTKNTKGVLGDNGFKKNIEVLILNKGNLLDKYSFKNQSILCDLKLPMENIKVIDSEGKKNQSLFFALIDSCDGEEPYQLNINIWNNQKTIHKIEVPVYFENSEEEINFTTDISDIDFKSDNIKKFTFEIIERLVDVKFDKYNLSKATPIVSNSKCFNKIDIKAIKDFAENGEEKDIFNIDNDINIDVISNYIKDVKCKKTISFSNILDCTDNLKCEIYCSFNRTSEELDEGELGEEILYLYFKKHRGKISLYKLESSGR
ncbi:hypothetical protein [Cellulophaga sp. L1A9]|uniref:hypothetical protein n=1 Tax=Cellulophaga sp. L1A9 TaxID=2686362 RepID=UPI00131E245E|nr:hypothetical protein [Cellulophaga sp. L1A9]